MKGNYSTWPENKAVKMFLKLNLLLKCKTAPSHRHCMARKLNKRSWHQALCSPTEKTLADTKRLRCDRSHQWIASFLCNQQLIWTELPETGLLGLFSPCRVSASCVALLKALLTEDGALVCLTTWEISVSDSNCMVVRVEWLTLMRMMIKVYMHFLYMQFMANAVHTGSKKLLDT